MRFRYASDDEDMPDSAELFNYNEADILVAEEDEEILGYAVYTEADGLGAIEQVEVHYAERGAGIGSALVDRVLEEADADALYAHAVAMGGKIQNILQKRGFEASGLRASNFMYAAQPKASRGFNLDFWKLDEHIEAYIPDELRDFTDASLGDHRQISYLEPEREPTGSLDIIKSDTSRGKRSNILRLKVGEGNTIKNHVEDAVLGFNDNYWAKTVELDTSEPLAHSVSKTLYDNGFKPVDLSPETDGQELTMVNIGVEAGEFPVTPQTKALIEKTELDFRTEGEGELSDSITFLPNEGSQH